MQGVLFAPFAIFHQFNSFRIIFLVLVCAIIAALAFRARKSNSVTHDYTSLKDLGFPVNNIPRKYITSTYFPSIQSHLKKPGAPDVCKNYIMRNKFLQVFERREFGVSEPHVILSQ